ncbi:MAG: trypsin-like peptidase domain-containing protein [Myxococcaceae bacterium]|nr:trypsin-like peptidase domain-containing protein [Myxococcaceae bacterium]MCA3012672.1 trypsin-like peptidase domain-containing protein [Myxococcaceae bacterium]
MSPLALVVAVSAVPLEQLVERVDGAVVTVRVAERRASERSVTITTGTGSGVLLHADGWVVTAAHVVDDADRIEVEFVGDESSTAQVVSSSRTEDLALLKLDRPPKRPVVATLGDSEALKPGMRLFAIGAPLGLTHTVTSGVVSALRTDARRGLHPSRLIQTDVPINQGNSGGPIFNEAGEVVGIASFIASRSGGSVGLNFAVPASTVRSRLFDAPLPWVGVSVRFVSRELSEVMNWPSGAGLLVEKVKAGGAAAEAGLHGGSIEAEIGGATVLLGGDLVLRVNGLPTSEPRAIGASLAALRPGEAITYEVLCAGTPKTVVVPLPSLPKVPALPPLRPASKAH